MLLGKIIVWLDPVGIKHQSLVWLIKHIVQGVQRDKQPFLSSSFSPFPRYFNWRRGKLMVPTAIGHPWAAALWATPSHPCHGDISHVFWLQGAAQFNPIFEWINIISFDELMALNVWGMNYAHIHLLPNVPHSWAESLLNQSCILWSQNISIWMAITNQPL